MAGRRRSLPDGLTHAEAAEILDCSPAAVRRLIRSGALRGGPPHLQRRLRRDQVEQLAAERWRRQSGPQSTGSQSYWVGTNDAARMLDVSPERVRVLATSGRLPCLTAAGGQRIFRRWQVEMIGAEPASPHGRGGDRH
jgi:excisionase family DNA binding protein